MAVRKIIKKISKRSKYLTIRGQTGQIEKHLEALVGKGFSQFIIVCGYPKSGNTWLCRLLAESIACTVAGFAGDPTAKELAAQGQEKRASPIAVLKSHHCHEVLSRIKSPSVQLIHICRDPRDVAVSAAFYFFAKDGDKFDRAIEMLTQYGAYPRLNWGDRSWTSFCASFQGSVPSTSYEALIVRRGNELRHVVHTLGATMSPEQADRAFSRHTFEAAKRRAQSEFETQFLRSGTTGEYRKYLNEQQIYRIESSQRDLMIKLGYSIVV